MYPAFPYYFGPLTHYWMITMPDPSDPVHPTWMKGLMPNVKTLDMTRTSATNKGNGNFIQSQLIKEIKIYTE